MADPVPRTSAASAPPHTKDASPGQPSTTALAPVVPAGPWGAAMDEFISTALAQDPSIERARSNIAAAEDGVSAAKWQFGPTPSISIEPAGAGYSANKYVNVIRITQPLYTGGALTANLHAARATVRGSEQELAAARVQLRQRLVTGWADWVKASRRAQSLEELRSQHAQLLALIQRRASSGISTQSDAALATSRLSAVEAELAQARLESALQFKQLQRLALRPVEPGLVQALDGALPASPNINQLLDRIQMSPEMTSARTNVEIAQEELNKAKASLLPTVSLRFDQQSGVVHDQRIGLVMQASFSGGLGAFASVNSARHRIVAAQAVVTATEQELFNRYQLEYTRYAAAAASARASIATATASEQVLASYRRQFEAGKRAWLDLLNMVRETHAARQAVHDARIDERAGLYRLQVLLDQRPSSPLADSPSPGL